MATLNTFILLTATSMPTTIKREHTVDFHGNSGYANMPQYNGIHTTNV